MLSLDQKNRRQALAILMTRLLALPLSDDALREYGLGRPLAAFVAGDDVIGFQALAWIAELCGAVGLAWDVWSSALPAERLAQLFDSPLLVQFLMVHDDGGTLWFNKERFEELITWLALQAAFEQARGEDQVVLPVTELTALAAAAGYRVRSLLKLAEGVGEGEA